MLTKMKVILALCGSLLVGGVGVAAAQGWNGGGKADVIKKYDANGDGKLDDGERQNMHADMKAKREAKKQEMLAKYDINKDGKLDKTERAVMINDKAEAAFKKADTNGDGQISMTEFKQFRQANHGMRHGRGGHGHRRGFKAGGNGAGQP
jgi:hypothetical protein